MAAVEDRSTLIRGVRVYDGTALSSRTSVLIQDATIVAIDPDLDPTGSVVVDGADGALLPGFIDAHVHLQGVGDLEKLARVGVTTALDMACWPRELVDELRHRRGLTDIRSAGIPATAPGSMHSKLPGRPQTSLVTAPSEANSFVRDRLAEGSDYIKVISQVPGFDQATLDALVEATHRHGKQVVAHASDLVSIQMAVSAHVDVITHAPLEAVLDAETIALMLQYGAVSVPTLTMMQAVAARFMNDDVNNPRSAGPGFHNASETVAQLHRAGVPILAGTDANTSPGAPAAIAHGESLHLELELLVGAGLQPGEAIAAATRIPAKHFGLTDRGAVSAGLRADLVLISGDPLTNIRDTRSIERVWCCGIEVEQRSATRDDTCDQSQSAGEVSP